MSQMPKRRTRAGRRSFVATCLLVLAAALLLSACGGSSKSSTSATTASRTNAGGGPGAPNGANRARFAQIRACLQKQGIKLPQRPIVRGPGSGPAGPPPTGGPPRGGRQLFGGTKFRDALRKCGFAPGQGRFNRSNPAYRKSLASFVQCVRKSGFNLPDPNLSGNGPVFDPSKINRNDPKFIAASRKCQSVLLPGRRPAGPPPGVPPSTAGGGA
jgi:hypothetical protein